MTATPSWDLFVNGPRHTEDLLRAELSALGAPPVSAARGSGLFYCGVDQTLAYRICLWSRLANRVLLRLASFAAPDAEALYRGVRQIPWHEHLGAGDTFAVDASARGSALQHSHFAALKVKDAVVDQLRQALGSRPTVDTVRPNLLLNLHLERDVAYLNLDLSGESLHRRGYRVAQIDAPLKENLAAAILLRAGWPRIAQRGGGLFDPMCGSGTLLIEAALMAADIAPGLGRQRFGFERWRHHDAAIWQSLTREAEERRAIGLATLARGRLVGLDRATPAVGAAKRNAEAAGLADWITIREGDVGEAAPAADNPAGLVVTNPPYGERLASGEPLPALYRRLGARLRQAFGGWQGAVLTADPELAVCLGMRGARRNLLFNGALACQLLRFELDHKPRQPRTQPGLEGLELEKDAFANRLRKNRKRLARWARQNQISCYRLYDADIPEYAVAVDVYAQHLHVQEYQAPKFVEPKRARARLRHILEVLSAVLDVPAERLHLKVRRRQKGQRQYERLARHNERLCVEEGGHRFWVNLRDYLDTGLFLDHRPTRALLSRLAPGRTFLNLFAYTGSATVYAAKAGAPSSLSVDLSNTYTRWARDNLRLNGISEAKHRLLRADCLALIADHTTRYDLIFLDPPTFSTSTGMKRPLDLQRDHASLLRAVAKLLTPEGVLIFSTNHRRFRLAASGLEELAISDISADTIDEDFRRNPRIHRCYRITRKS